MFSIMRILSVALLLLASANVVAAQTATPAEQIMDLTSEYQCATRNWPGRGLAPKAYVRGVALVFARAVCNPARDDVKIASAAKAPGPEGEKKDALSWYNSQFAALGMSNDIAGLDALRHTYALLIGLGMRESSGRYCLGRDTSADFTEADTAEAGLFQTSWGARTRTGNAQSVLESMFDAYAGTNPPRECYLTVFSDRVRCRAQEAENFGTGKGAEWQKFTKSCPAFATEYGAIILRRHGGRRGEFGPIRTKATELRKSCDRMLMKVQDLLAANPQFCAELK
jgi:hypothetical protein